MDGQLACVYQHDNFRPFDEAWTQQFERAVQELTEAVRKRETVILVDENVWGNNAVSFPFSPVVFFGT